MAEKQTKFIFVTGGVVSGLGKGITAASLGRLLKCRGLKVASQKLDPYVNVDPGTMSPLQHGEVFVTDDGTETDLDLGHYERFIDENLNKYSNLILYTHALIIFKDFLCNFCAVTTGIHGLFFYVAVCLGFGHVLVLHKAAFCPADQPHLCDLFL